MSEDTSRDGRIENDRTLRVEASPASGELQSQSCGHGDTTLYFEQDLLSVADQLSWQLVAARRSRKAAEDAHDIRTSQVLDEVGQLHQRHYLRLLRHLGEPPMSDQPSVDSEQVTAPEPRRDGLKSGEAMVSVDGQARATVSFPLPDKLVESMREVLTFEKFLTEGLNLALRDTKSEELHKDLLTILVESHTSILRLARWLEALEPSTGSGDVRAEDVARLRQVYHSRRSQLPYVEEAGTIH